MRKAFLICTLSVFMVSLWAVNSSYAQSNVALGKTVELMGAPFFTGGWGGGMIVSEDTVVDGVFLPRGTQWDQGAVWWDCEQDLMRRVVVIRLGSVFRIEELIVQADDNDAYLLHYWDLDADMWKLAWHVPNYDELGWGMQTRPDPDDNTATYELPAPIFTNALSLQGDMEESDRLFAVSEIQALGYVPVEIDIKPETLNLKSGGEFTAFIDLPEGYDEADIDVDTVECEGAPALKGMVADDGRFIAKFDREDLDDVATGEAVELTVTGELNDGTAFAGSDIIRVIGPGKPAPSSKGTLSTVWGKLKAK